MKEQYIIGVDIGGTNTDAVLVDGNERILNAVKTTTTDDISQGFKTALRLLLDRSHVPLNRIEGLFVGTTHATNAILQRKELFRVGAIRIAGHYPDMLPACFAWPKELKKAVCAGMETISGGFECHGGALAPLHEEEARKAIQNLLKQGAESIAIIGLFSPLSGKHEEEIATLVHELAGKDFPISCSHKIGGIGFIERENSTILNASLKRVMRSGFQSLETAAREMGITAPLMITQNDGSLIDMAHAIEYPVLTISAGPTNSFIGGAKLARQKDAIIVDIGGTSTDVGLVQRGFPNRNINISNIGGVMLNFPMPNVLSIALGGGSLIAFSDSNLTIGPTSVAKDLQTHAQAFGGSQLTLTDVALSLDYLKIPHADGTLVSLSHNVGQSIFDQVRKSILQLVCKMQGESMNLSVILVGGGAGLLPASFLTIPYTIPPHFDVANAYGAALAEIAGTVDTVVSLQNREEILESLHEAAKQKAVDAGAKKETLRLIDQQIIPYSYIPNHLARVIIKYCGKRKVTRPSRPGKRDKERSEQDR
jgi:N-methylhydantoinase A/oxoprolinase/acetone carboxylase beta subunit